MLFHEEAFTRIKSERSQKGRDFPILRVKMAPAAGFEPATKWLTEAVFEPGNTLFSLKDRSS